MKKNLFSFYIILAVIGLTIIFLFPIDGKTECSRQDSSCTDDSNIKIIMEPAEAAVENAALAGQATLISPSGETFDTTPTYTWTAVASATWYHIWINTSTGTLGEKWYTAAEVGCPSGTGNCSLTAPTGLAPGAYTWWIQAWYNAYGPWSDGKPFYVDPNGKNCQNINAVGFTPANSSITYSTWGSTGERYRTGGTGWFEAPLHLPVGAQITNIFLDYWDEYASGDVSVAFCDIVHGTALTCYPVSSPWSTPGYRQLQGDLTNQNIIINNVGHSYIVRVDLPAINYTTSFVRATVCHKPIP